MYKAIVLRGLPGSGKSSYIQALTSELPDTDYKIHSTDHYFYSGGQYNFDKGRLAEFHQKNKQAFAVSMQQKLPLVICDNTNILEWQYQPYVQLAIEAGYEVEIISIGILRQKKYHEKYAERNFHGVEISTMSQMIKGLKVP